MSSPRPTIKGIYVLSHIRALTALRGEKILYELLGRYQKPLDFQDDDDVPVADEVAILECIVDIDSPKKLSPEERALLAGRLHFKNFTSTQSWKILGPLLRRNMRTVLMQSRHIANRVFKGVIFMAEGVNSTTVRIKLTNNDYPLEHFQGFFEEWLIYSGFVGAVEAHIDPDNVYVYTITWRE